MMASEIRILNVSGSMVPSKRRYFAVGVSTGYPAFIQAPVPPDTFKRLVKPNCSNKLAAALER
jgi:hypothetical protein